jgi:hypothetical protein
MGKELYNRRGVGKSQNAMKEQTTYGGLGPPTTLGMVGMAHPTTLQPPKGAAQG